ncbi:Flagellar M-ring protein [Luteitalea pratensis]|uniref:Flagellar M-ring protein n=1 Tax=Luteitalea pratensis TaxID=1855912 RepID=A0A143PQP2_LUTPR|nr:flagellar basal-body MS-ring/collar protein FliF [Luteitalea pratensis]AMY10438.1 Flagellar M-ring protein [Luteitalea pratensis]
MAFLPVQWQALVEKSKVVRASLSTAQLISLAAVFVGVLGLVIGSTWYLNRTEYRVLFSELNGEEAARVVERLKGDNVAYQLQDGGRTVLVPTNSTDNLRLQFAGEGMPTSGRIGFEIFDKVAFGQTEFLEHVNYRRALEGELARTISTLTEVQAARVHIAMQKESLFGAREQPAKASVTLTLKGTRALPPQAATSITNLVAASVEGLRPEQVVIIDSTGRSLARGAMGQDDGAMAGADLERQQKYERDMGMKVVALLEPVVGVERVRANVSVQLHGASQEQTTEQYDPETVLRSESTLTEGNTADSNGGIAGAQANLPAVVRPDGTPSPSTTGSTTTSRGLTKSTKLSNYEVSKTVTHTIRPRGEVAKVSVAVLVDDEHVTTTAQDGTVSTKRKPRDPGAMQKLQKLVAASLGIDTQRGDMVSVENIPFEAPVSEPIAKPSMWQRVSDQSSGAVRGLAVLLIVAMVLLLVVRPVVGRLLAVPALDRPHATIGMPQQLPRTIEEIEGEIEARLDAMPNDGDRRQPVLTRRVATLANKEPESAAKLVRGWLTEGRS